MPRESDVDRGQTQRGFAGAAVRDITAEAGVPQGCFTNHFRSKEAFGVAILDRYSEHTRAIMDITLHDLRRPAVDRLRAYFDAITEWLEAVDWRYGCLVGNMSLEVSEHSELLREHLMRVCHSLTKSFAETVQAGQAAGEIRADLDADDVATFILASWEGAIMRMKVDRSPTPLEQFKRVLFASVLSSPERHGRARRPKPSEAKTHTQGQAKA
jgi:TetR/AcrR family transcriptional repressor of nem operon